MKQSYFNESCTIGRSDVGSKNHTSSGFETVKQRKDFIMQTRYMSFLSQGYTAEHPPHLSAHIPSFIIPSSQVLLPSFTDFQRQCDIPVAHHVLHVSPLRPTSVPRIVHQVRYLKKKEERNAFVNDMSTHQGGHERLVQEAPRAASSRSSSMTSQRTLLTGIRYCKAMDCPKQSQRGGFCKTHGGGRRCTHDGCGKSSQSKGLCRRHGGGKLCSFEGCTSGPQRGGRCHIVSKTRRMILLENNVFC